MTTVVAIISPNSIEITVICQLIATPLQNPNHGESVNCLELQSAFPHADSVFCSAYGHHFFCAVLFRAGRGGLIHAGTRSCMPGVRGLFSAIAERSSQEPPLPAKVSA